MSPPSRAVQAGEALVVRAPARRAQSDDELVVLELDELSEDELLDDELSDELLDDDELSELDEPPERLSFL